MVNGGATQTVNKLNLNITIDAANWIFFDGINDLSNASIEAALASLTTKEFFAWEQIGFEKIGGIEAGWKAEIEATRSNATLPEVHQR